MTRQLAAVLAADVAEYSRLMGADANGMLAALRRLRAELFRPMVAGHRGTVVKSMGDGWIVTFASAEDAVTCAMRLQDALVLEPDIRLRLGVHLGDIVHEDEDVFGDGVNVAARLEALCEPGGVTISDAVHGALDGTLRPAFDDAGKRALKNIDRAVRVWTRGGITGAAAIKDREGMEGFPRLSIRPVTTNSASGEVRDLADALTHDLATYLGATRWLRTRVAAQSDPGGFVLAEKLRASGARFRLDCRLTGWDGSAVWGDKFDGAVDDLFDWQDQTASTIATRVLAKVGAAVVEAASARPEAQRGWEDFMLLGLHGRDGADRASFERGLDFVSRAIALDPPSSYPYDTALALWASAVSIGFTETAGEYTQDTAHWLERARALAGPVSSSRVYVAFFEFVRSMDAALARSEIDRFLRDLPFESDALLFGGFLFNYLGEPENALQCFRKFVMFSGDSAYGVPARMGTGVAKAMLGQYEEALVWLEEAARMNPDYPAPYCWMAAVLGMLGRIEEARVPLAQHDRLFPGMTVSRLRARSAYLDTELTRFQFEGLARSGMPE